MIKKVAIIFLGFIFTLAVSSLAISQMDMKTIDDLYSQIEIFSYALTTIQSEYVDEKTPQELIYGSLTGMLASLDPHSQFLTPEDYQDLKTETQGRFGGLGIEISIREGLLTIITPIEGTPAWEVGLKAGDRIVKIEDELTKDITLSDAVKLLRGEAGTDVNITVLRESEFKLYDFTITRKIIEIQDIKNTQILEDKIGYVRIAEFREDTHEEFQKAMEQLRDEGADSLVVDLRNNPGGLLNVAIDITDEFLPADEMIVSTKGRRPSQNLETFAKDRPNKVLDWPVVVLINEGSASGSEILAGALKDNKRAIIVGAKSFGKGSVQSVIPLPDGSGLRLTTSKLFTPSGVTIHGEGITPDVEVERIYPDEDEDKEEDEDEDEDEDKKYSEERKKRQEELDKIFDDVEINEAEDPEELQAKKREMEIHKRLMEDNQVITAISVIKGIRVFKSFEDAG